jgi:hypothetical protein
MADNTTFGAGNNATPPDGLVVAGDEIAGALHQRIKIQFGVDGTANDVSDTDRLPVNEGDASNTYGEQLSVPSGNTVTLVTFVAPAAWRFTGFEAGGEVDGKFFVQFGASTKYVVRTNIANRQASLRLPHADPGAGGLTVDLKVTNTGETSGDYEGTLLGI